jgi:hypothetical protein
MANGGNWDAKAAQAEHIGPTDTGDNIEAKRVASYAWDGSNWQRMGLQITPLKDFDYFSVTSSGTNQDTIVYKLGGSGGSTVLTMNVTYASGAEKMSSSIGSIGYS